MWHHGVCASNAATCKPFAPSCHPERGSTAEPRDLDRANRARARCEHAELFLAKKLLCAIGVQRFYLDPATASPCGLLARRSLASQTSTSLRCAQDDTDGMLIADAAGASPALRVCANNAAKVARERRGRRPRRPVWYDEVCANKAATLAFPKRGKVPSIAREARWSEADEDVGSCFMGKCFGVRLRADVRYSFVNRGWRREQAPPLPVCAPIYNKSRMAGHS